MLKLFKWLGFEKKSYVFPTFYFVYSFTLLYNNEEKKIETYFDIQNYSLLVYEGSELLMTSSNQEGVSSTCWTKKKKISRALRAKPGTARYNIVQSRIMFI